MTWSTRQLAELAGTTVKAVRHYHATGLLDLPERAANGYKQYKIPHLVRLLQIKRLSDLGVPLAQIAVMGKADEESEEAIRALDAELAASVERINRVRAELALALRHRAPAHVPPALAPFSRQLTESKRSMLTVLASVFDKQAIEGFGTLDANPDPAEVDFDALPPDADEAAIEEIARRLVPVARKTQEDHPWTKDPTAGSPLDPELTQSAIAEVVLQMYHPAQLAALRRLRELMVEQGLVRDGPETPPDSGKPREADR
ncbi:transcriptional regulator, MerR family [Actinosynnema mirum DSM 43827]|uniref:Transcriptional regulator, MerR family n=2 Tax=Actinosynnema mirum TaxID=40567 RepID=C6WIJ4_ACTMD|nr:transcriptional regulator, MerR family [Actinosynnema mirum DSM 43827]